MFAVRLRMVQVRLSTMLHEVNTDFRLQKRSPLSLCSISKIYPPPTLIFTHPTLIFTHPTLIFHSWVPVAAFAKSLTTLRSQKWEHCEEIVYNLLFASVLSLVIFTDTVIVIQSYSLIFFSSERAAFTVLTTVTASTIHILLWESSIHIARYYNSIHILFWAFTVPQQQHPQPSLR